MANTGPFANIEAYKYWSGVEYSDDTTQAWVFDFNGIQVQDDKVDARFIWPVFDGDPLAVNWTGVYTSPGLCGLGETMYAVVI